MTVPVRVRIPAAGADPVVVESDLMIARSVPHLLLAVYVVQDGTRAYHPVQGRYALRASRMEFTPLYPFATGQDYEIEVNGRPQRTFSLARPAPPTAPRLVEIFPTARRIPRNTLRLHITFSAPMQRQRAPEFLRLLDDDGRDVSEIIVDLGQELWSPDSTRLTVLLDAGRAKRAIHATPEPGPALTEGRTYALVVEPGWPAATGATVTAGSRRSFEIGPARRAPLDTHTWNLSTPRASSRDPAQLDFATTMDIATLSNRIRIDDHHRHPVPGTVAIGPGEQRWTFTPAQRWADQTHQLVIEVDLEDVAGNRLGEALDHAPQQRGNGLESLSLAFYPSTSSAISARG